MAHAIFLSASVPDPRRSPEFARSGNTTAITSAVSALTYVVLGRRLLVWGGHPAITPMIAHVADEMGIDYGRWVRLYQSLYFSEEFPEDNERFRNVTYVKPVPGDLRRSLRALRKQMFTENSFAAAVFVGGMDGVLEEYEMFRELQPNALVLPIASTGGAALAVAERRTDLPRDLLHDLDYISVFHRLLGISVREERYRTPEEQPAEVADRYWHQARG